MSRGRWPIIIKIVPNERVTNPSKQEEPIMSEEPKKRPVQNDRDDRDIEGFEIDTGNGIHAVANLAQPEPRASR